MAQAMVGLFPQKQHVYPVDDLKPHDTESGKCWCNPQSDDFVVIHNSQDGREDYEVGRKWQ